MPNMPLSKQTNAFAAQPGVIAFADSLTELCLKHGVGITGEPELFVMQPEDYELSYKVDENSRLVRA